MNSPPNNAAAPTRPFLIAWLCYSAVVILVLALRILLLPPGLTEWMDFRQLYAGGYLIRTDSTNLYDFENQKAVQNGLISNSEGFIPYNHPPYEALLFGSYLTFRIRLLTFVSLRLISFYWLSAFL